MAAAISKTKATKPPTKKVRTSITRNDTNPSTTHSHTLIDNPTLKMSKTMVLDMEQHRAIHYPRVFLERIERRTGKRTFLGE